MYWVIINHPSMQSHSKHVHAINLKKKDDKLMDNYFILNRIK